MILYNRKQDMFKKKSVEKKNSSPKKSTRTKTQTKETTDYIKQKQISAPEYQYIANENHYEKVIEKIKDCKKHFGLAPPI